VFGDGKQSNLLVMVGARKLQPGEKPPPMISRISSTAGRKEIVAGKKDLFDAKEKLQGTGEVKS